MRLFLQFLVYFIPCTFFKFKKKRPSVSVARIILRQKEYSRNHWINRGIIIYISDNTFHCANFIQIYLFTYRLRPSESFYGSFIDYHYSLSVFFIQHITFYNVYLKEINIILIDCFIL